jgi:SAM-dependent methyltransferase
MTDPRTIADFNDADKAEANKRKYRSFDHQALHREFYADLGRRIDAAKRIGATVRVLDIIGSGTGENARLLAELGANVVAVEPAATMRSLGSDYYCDSKIRLENDALPNLESIKELAARDGGFDAVLLSASIQYVAPEELDQAVRSIVDLTKPGGTIRITYPTPPSRDGQYAIPVERLLEAVQRVDAQARATNAPGVIIEKNSSQPASDGRRALNGEPLRFVELDLCRSARHALQSRASEAHSR